MPKWLKITILAILGFIAVLMTALQICLNSRMVTGAIDDFDAAHIDGTLSYKDLRVSVFGSFPRIRVTIDSVSVTYPHDKFAEYDSSSHFGIIEDAGRGEVVDTLASFDKLTAAVNIWHIFAGRLRLSDLHLDNPAAFAHKYDSTAANWDIFKFTSQPEDTSKTSLQLPWISSGDIVIGGSPRLVYTDVADTVLAAVNFDRFLLKGDVKFSSGAVKTRGVRLDLDSLSVLGRLPADTLDLRLDRLRIAESAGQVLDLGLSARVLAVNSAFGQHEVPIGLDGSIKYVLNSKTASLDVRQLNVHLANLPLHLEGNAELLEDGIKLKADASIADFPIDSLLRNYFDYVADISRGISTNARLNVDFSADGLYSHNSFPHLTASVSIPDSRTTYAPLDVSAAMTLGAEADMSPDKHLNATVNVLKASIPGLSLDADGTVDDLLGGDPLYTVRAGASADLAQILRLIPESLGIRTANGDLGVKINVRSRQSEIDTYKFREADIRGSVHSDWISLSMPADSLDSKLYRTDISVKSNPDGIDLQADFDSLYLNMGVGLQARVRDMKNNARIFKVLSEGEMTPKVYFSSDNGGAFAKVGSSRYGLRNAKFVASAQRHSLNRERKMKHLLDSLQRVYVGVPRKDLIETMMQEHTNRPVPSFLSEKDFEKGDVDISLDSTLTRYLRLWTPSLSLKATHGFYASPVLPLRTRFSDIDIGFDNDDLCFESFKVTSGTSDLSLNGHLRGLWRSLIGGKGLIRPNLKLHSDMLNVNELVAAYKLGHKDIGEVAPVDEADESFVTDTLADAKYVPSAFPLIIVPANVAAAVDYVSDSLKFADFKVAPFSCALKMQERTAQIVNTDINTNIGTINLDAYYSTKTKKDISTGFNLKLCDMSAHEIIHLLPTVDSLMPALKSFEGKLGCEISATSKIDTNMNVIIPSLDGLVRITGKDLEVKDAGKLRKVTRLLMFKNPDIGRIDDMKVDAVIHNSKIEVFPFELGVDRYKLALRGMQGFDKSMYYHISILKSPFLLRFGVNVYGTLDDWRFSLGRAKYRDGKVPAFTQQLDSAQFNIIKSIHNVYAKGIEEIDRHNAKSLDNIEKRKKELAYTAVDEPDEPLSVDELLDIANININLDLQEQENALMDEVDAVLDASYVSISKLMEEYESSTYDKRMMRKVERIKRKAARKAEREALVEKRKSAKV